MIGTPHRREPVAPWTQRQSRMRERRRRRLDCGYPRYPKALPSLFHLRKPLSFNGYQVKPAKTSLPCGPLPAAYQGNTCPSIPPRIIPQLCRKSGLNLVRWILNLQTCAIVLAPEAIPRRTRQAGRPAGFGTGSPPHRGVIKASRSPGRLQFHVPCHGCH